MATNSMHIMKYSDDELYSNMKVVIVTGATSGIGRALAESLYDDGKKVIICGRRTERLAEISSNKKDRMIPYELDVSNRKACEEFVKKIVNDHPDVDTLVNNAGSLNHMDFSDGGIPEELWSEEILVNIHALIRLSNLFIPHLKSKSFSTIINVSSGLGLNPIGGLPVYCGTKAFIHSFSRSLRYQLKDTSIRVVEIVPPAVDTELGPSWKSQMSEQIKARLMPLDSFTKQMMESLKKGELEFGVGSSVDNLKLVQETEHKRFDIMNSYFPKRK